MQRIAYWSIPIIAIIVTVLVVLFLIQINTDEPDVTHRMPSSNTVKSTAFQATESTWLERFSQSEQEGFFYPVNEIFIALELHRHVVKENAFTLSALVKNQYQLFCLQEELKQRGFRFFLKKVREGTELLVYSKDHNQLQSLVKALKSYKIRAKILPYKEVENG